jgi:glycosyltransferase involved in cell wall biosynthesis
MMKSAVPRKKFIFTGEIDDVEKYYPLMDVKLITSVPRSEGTTTTAIEAMACGIPIVAHEVGSIREIVENGRTGFLVPPLDTKAVAHAVLCLLQDYGLCKKMGAEARRKAVENYDVEVCADIHVHAFKAAIENQYSK